MASIGIFSYERDLHVHTIADHIREQNHHQAHIISTDTLVSHGGISWQLAHPHKARLKDYDGEWVSIEELNVVWWRRVHQPVNFPDSIVDEIDKDFITHEWRGALSGAVFDAYSGIWVNHPAKDSLAANKLYQLTQAQEGGFQVPDTLISQQPKEIREFCDHHRGSLVVKKLTGSSLKATVSLVVKRDQLNDDEMLSICPAMYQEIIHSNKHLRVNCFGDQVYPFLIQSDQFDWRRNMNIPMHHYPLPDEINDRIVKLTQSFGLMYGIYDMILPDHGEPIWLELNPQGQFLFCEALSGYPLGLRFAEFLTLLADTSVN